MIVILYVMDSLRPDFLSCYGYEKKTSPHIDQLAQEGILFTNAFSQSTWTRPSGASILSSYYPSAHGVLTLKDALPYGVPLLPEALKANGFRTIALSAIVNISPFFGFGRGFDRFVEIYHEEAVKEKRKLKTRGWKWFPDSLRNVPVGTSEDLNEFLFPFLEENKDRDLFIFAWSMDTHNPFFHRDASMARFCVPSEEVFYSDQIVKRKVPEAERSHLKCLYEDMIYYNDHHLGRLIARLKELDIFDQTFFILTSDHGESFGQHGVDSHMGTPYDHQIRVPLIMKFPHSEFRGSISALAQHVDLVPTILDYGNLENGNPMYQGRSLLPLLRDKIPVNDFVFAEYHLLPKFPKYRALRTTEYKYVEIRPGDFTVMEWLKERNNLWPLAWVVYHPRWLFSLKDDPGEQENIHGQKKELEEEFQSQIKKIVRANRERSREPKGGKVRDQDMDEEIKKQLHALGYFDK
jgi:arylsulfatase A-like enzyme